MTLSANVRKTVANLKSQLQKLRFQTFQQKMFGGKSSQKLHRKLHKLKVPKTYLEDYFIFPRKSKLIFARYLSIHYCQAQLVMLIRRFFIHPFLKGHVNSHPLSGVNALVVDGMFFAKENIARFNTYQAFARNMLKEVLKITSTKADLVFDVYVLPFIKDIERKGRGGDETSEVFSIGTKQKIEGNIN